MNPASSRFAVSETSSSNRLNLLAFSAIAGGVLLFLLTRRIEVMALIGVPLALRMMTSFRTCALVTTCAMLVWLSRAPAVFFDLVLFSYAVYAAVAITMVAFFVRFVHHGARRLPLITNLWLGLYVLVVVLGGLNGLRNVEAIPTWVLSGTSADFGNPWVYFRAILLPGLLLPLLTMITAVAIVDRQKLDTALLPAWTLAGAMALLVLAFVATSGASLGTMSDASYRNEHLKDLGFHSNELGTFLAIGYALLIGARTGMTDRRARTLGAFVLCAIGVALVLTFSRGALLAFLVINGWYLMFGSTRNRALFIAMVLIGCLLAPAAVFERAQFGVETRDLNEISAGRLDNIWLPLLPDVADHLWFGQGLHSIMWTDAQRHQQMFPVNIAHNAYLDLVLDVGIAGGILILCWYIYLWRAFRRGAATDPDSRYRAVFFGGQLAMLALFTCALSNDRLTPTAPTCLLWLVSGVLLGRQAYLQRPRAWVPAPAARRPLVMACSRGDV